MDIMIDIETLSTSPDAAILSIGAVVFSRRLPVLTQPPQFYRAVTPGSNVDLRREIDAATVAWWMRQAPEAQAVFKAPGAIALSSALLDFGEWLKMVEPATAERRVWGNGASFDLVILRRAYGSAGTETPWSYWNEQCFRTLRATFPDIAAPTSPATAHNALDDALAQAIHAEKIFAHIGQREATQQASLKIGDEVSKVGGDYRFDGHVVGIATKRSRQIRYLVEDDRGVLHVYKAENLRKRGDES